MPPERLPHEWFDAADDATDPLAQVRPWPHPVSSDDVPDALRDNPLVRAYLALTPEQERGLVRLAESDAREDEAVAAALIASVR